MPEVDFDKIHEMVGESDDLRIMQVLVRSSLASGADNIPALAIVSKDALYYGGSEAMGGKFKRVSRRSIVKSRKVGKAVWECIELKHMEIDGERTIYVCPFSGHPNRPIKDDAAMAYLLEFLTGE